MPVLLGREWELQEATGLWTLVLEKRFQNAGATATVLPLGMPAYGQPNAATFTTGGDQQVVFTWSEAPSSFDTPLSLPLESSYQGVCPIVDFNGTDEEADTPSVAYWQAAAQAFSIVAWVKPDAFGAVKNILSKYNWQDGVGHQGEWRFSFTAAGKLRGMLIDGTNFKLAYTDADAALATGVWHHVAMTYDGSDTAAGINLYVNGVLVASTDTTEAGFASVVASAIAVRLACEGLNGAAANFFDGRMAGGPLGPLFCQVALGADLLLRDYWLTRGLVAV